MCNICKQYLQRSNDGLRSTATRVMNGCKPLCRCREPSLVPLQDLPMHLIVKSSSHNRLYCLDRNYNEASSPTLSCPTPLSSSCFLEFSCLVSVCVILYQVCGLKIHIH